MTIATTDIIALRPTPDDIRAAVSYAIKSGDPYTYNRMGKDAWRRVARIARGKVNETMIRRHAASMGIASEEQQKSYRDHDDFDFTFAATRGRVEADVKTFHVLTHFLSAPRQPFSLDELLCGVNSLSKDWHRFFPMLIPQDYKEHKEVYVFGVSVEAGLDSTAKSALPYPWSAFPDTEVEAFLVDPAAIAARERSATNLDVTLTWPALGGGGATVFEAGAGARQQPLNLKDAGAWSRNDLSSFLAIQVDDEARRRLWKQKAALSLTATEGATSITSSYPDARFREVFPRQDYVLYLIGWIGRDDFERTAQPIAKGSSCYFYPPKQSASDKHQPGTKTANRYVLPGNLNPIAKLMEA